MTEQKLCTILAAATVLSAVLFTGNGLWSRGQAVNPEITLENPVEDTTHWTEPETQPETTVEMQTLPVDPLPELLAAAAEGMDGSHIFVYDLTSGSMLYSGAAETERMYPASITKLYTAWLALQYLSPETVVTAGDELGLVQSGSSLAYISRGCRLRVDMLVEGMLMPSGNDAAYVLAAAAGREIAGDPSLSSTRAVERFVEEMNTQAGALGMVNSSFTNPDGYHAGGHYSCPQDIALIGSLAMGNETIRKYCAMEADRVVFASGEHITWYNTNYLVNPSSGCYASDAVGLKTGYTGEAGYCLLAAFENGEKQVLIGIFGAQQKLSRYENAAALWQCCG